MMQPVLSILICSIPSRFEKAIALYNHIIELVGDKNIEILMFTDNKKRTIGEKREAIKNISNGKYFMFVDDDDSLYSIQEIYDACQNDYDVITFKNKSLNSDGSSFIVTFGLGNEVEHNTNENGFYVDLNRPPFPQCAWHEKFRSVIYPAISYGEDWEWVKKAITFAEKEYHIDKVIHGYNFDPLVTEAVLTPKRCIVNLSTSGFREGQIRLSQTMQCHNVPVILFGSEKEVFAPPHTENPYAFKIYAIQAAREMGYDQILWLDSSVYAVKDITPVFDWLTQKGIFLEEAGHYAGSWAPDNVLKYFDITKEQAMVMPMFSAGYCGFDFTNQISIDFFATWKEAMLNGMFKGTWQESRHDMSAGSIIANKMGLFPLYSKGGTFFSYIGPGFETPKDSVVFHLRGI